ncbi:MAG: hypothetical protein HYV42_04085 [Candidatus Magasanikbacteria bacterium]|nr:hypothetical protein [Candidatus Magasanikbacteria bacterium]
MEQIRQDAWEAARQERREREAQEGAFFALQMFSAFAAIVAGALGFTCHLYGWQGMQLWLLLAAPPAIIGVGIYIYFRDRRPGPDPLQRLPGSGPEP